MNDRDCSHCMHYVMKVEVGNGAPPEHYWGCELWECKREINGIYAVEILKADSICGYPIEDILAARNKAISAIRKMERIEWILDKAPNTLYFRQIREVLDSDMP